jgi:hypothetical protein
MFSLIEFFAKRRRLIKQVSAGLLVAFLQFGVLTNSSLAQEKPRQSQDAATDHDGIWKMARQRASAAPHPRTFSDSLEWPEIWRALLQGERAKAYGLFLKRVRARLGQVVTMDKGDKQLDALSGTERALRSREIKQSITPAALAAQEAAFAALIEPSGPWRADAKAKMLALARLDPRGASGASQEDLSARWVTWTLALGLDWLPSAWSADERALILQSISVRMDDFAANLIHGPRPLRKDLLDSHPNEVLGALAETAILLLGETPAAERWFDDFVPLYVETTLPFAGDDGGYANGSTYAMVDIGEFSVRHWDTLRRAAGIDLRHKPWVTNFGRYMVYMTPPGTPVGSFGDGAEAEMSEAWARHARVFYAARVRQPLYDWYARQWLQEGMSSLNFLLSPAADFSGAGFPDGTPAAAVFTSVGVAAMHSDLQDRNRTSLYLRSSPFGSVSHGHADQNSFVLNAAGMPLLLDSGYYDFYNSPHHLGWTKRTIAHNAMTFDGGLGQDEPSRLQGTARTKGEITQFSTSADMDLLVGDATAAYRGQLSKASRGIVYLRPDTFVIFDLLESAIPRKWEWNLHAARQFETLGDLRLRAVNGDARVCIDQLADQPVAFEQHAGFPAAPQRSADQPRPDQWHGQFRAKSPSRRFMSVTVLRVGCVEKSIQPPQFDGHGMRVRIADVDIGFDGYTLAARKQ